MLKLVVTGGDRKLEYKLLEKKVSEVLLTLATEGLLEDLSDFEIVVSNRKGADSLSTLFAHNNKIAVKIFDVKNDRLESEELEKGCNDILNYAHMEGKGILIRFPSTANIPTVMERLARDKGMRVILT